MRVWLVWSNEHRAWWGPDRGGYTIDPVYAGRYTLEQALLCAGARSKRIDGVPPEVVVPSPELVAAFLGGTARRA